MPINWLSYKPPACASCGLRDQPGPCFGSGDPSTAKLIYIAQNPGEEEIRARPMSPLVGPSGRVFNRQLFEAGIPRRELFITNQVKCLTPGNREPTEAEVGCCRPLLARELSRCKSDTVLLAGSVAFKANIGRYSTLSPLYSPSEAIFERMGCVEQRDGRKWIATVHPAHVMRFMGTSIYGEAISHLRKAYHLSGVSLPNPKIITEPTGADITRHRGAAIASGIFADDIEAFQPQDVSDEDLAPDPTWEMDICGFSAVPYEAIVLPKSDLRVAWGEIWSRPDIMQAEHNGESDCAHLEHIAPQRNNRWDTMLAHHVLHNNIHKYLKPEVLRTYTNLPYYNRDIEDQVGRRFYCGMDNVTTLLAAKEQMRLMAADVYEDVRGMEGEPGGRFQGRLLKFFTGTAWPGEPAYKDILPLLEEQRRVGIKVDMRLALLFKVWLEHRVEETHKEIEALIGPGFNWRSYGPGGDVQTLFYERWKLPIQYKKNPKTRKRNVTCDDEARKHMQEWIEAVPSRKIDYAEASKYFTLVNESASVNKLLEYVSRIGGDSRLHSLQKAHGTINFRIASKPNTQNWPDWPILRKCKTCGRTYPGSKLLQSVECCGVEMPAGLPSMRAMVVPDNPEDLLLAADFDQAELWPYAVQFGIKYLLDIYASGSYIYGEVYEGVVGKQFFKKDGPRTKKNMTDALAYGSLREAKAIPLGFLYGMEGEKLAQRQGWAVEKGRYYRKEWERLNPELYAGHAWINYEMQQRKILRPPPGWLLHFPATDLAGLNCFGSSPAAWMLLSSAILINQAFKREALVNTRITHTVHDSMCINVGGGGKDPEIMRHVVEDILRPILSRPLPWLKNFQYRFSCTVGKQWDWGMVDYEKWIAKA